MAAGPAGPPDPAGGESPPPAPLFAVDRLRAEGLVERRIAFLGAVEDYAAARAVLFGLPMDFTTSFRAGSRMGPQRIREASDALEEYSIALDADLSEAPCYDLGDIVLAPGNVALSLERIGRTAEAILEDGKVPFGIGGEHLVSLPVIEAVARRHPDLVVLHFDAHADLRDHYLGERLSHATVLRRVAERLRPHHLHQFGIRSGTREEVAWGRRHAHFHPHAVLEPLREALPAIAAAGAPVYVTIDVDVIDPAFAPGTGTPEPGGASSGEMLEAIRAIGAAGLRVVGFDLVEVSPPQDPTERTQVLGAKLIREAALSFLRGGRL